MLKNWGSVSTSAPPFAGLHCRHGHRWPTFYLYDPENLRQFGALKAMGTSTATLTRMILLQAFTVGLTGYGLGVGLASLFGLMAAQGGGLPFAETWQLLALVLAALLSICTFSALISIVKLARLEPAIVFR
ncbi:MAG: ABC transporter permease [Nitrospira sp.]